jgi:hypothetical protein
MWFVEGSEKIETVLDAIRLDMGGDCWNCVGRVRKMFFTSHSGYYASIWNIRCGVIF